MNRSTKHASAKREMDAIARIQRSCAKRGVSKTASRLGVSDQAVRNWLTGQCRPNVTAVDQIESNLSEKTGRKSTAVAVNSTVRATHDAFNRVARESRHLRVLVTTNKGRLSENLSSWSRHRIQTAGERLISATVALMSANRAALNARHPR